MALLLKVDPVGIDRPIDKIQQALYTGLVTNGTWTMYESYHRAHKNESPDGIVPQVFVGKKDYKDVFTDDKFAATSFFLIPDEVSVVEGQKFQAEISIIFQVDLAKLYPNAPDSRRFDEEMHNEIINILNSLDANFTDVDYVTSLDSVYAGLDTSKIKWNDLQPYHVVRFSITANYDYQCNPVFATAGLVCTIGVDMSKTDPTTPGGNDGTATATPTGGQGSISYQWDDPGNQTTQTATGLLEGTYMCIVTDSIISIPPCNTIGNIELEDPAPICMISVIVSVTPETELGLNDGTASATPSGGQGTLTYLWTTGDGSIPGGTETNQNITGLSAGTYTVVVTDDIIPSPVCSATDNGTVDAGESAAQIFIDAAGITDETQQDAITDLVDDLIGFSLWDKIHYMYPFVGGSASQHSYNLKDPTLYQMTWNGGITHSATGVLGNGANGYGETNFTPNGIVDKDSFTLGYYSRTNNASAAQCDVGGLNSSVYCTILLFVNNIYTAINQSPITGTALTSSDKLILGTRTTSSVVSDYRDAVLLTTKSQTSSSAYNTSLKIMCYDDSGSLIRFSTREQAMSLAMEGLNATEVTNLNTAIVAYQTALSRNV